MPEPLYEAAGEISEPGDTDTYELELVEGEQYNVAVLGASTGGGSLPDPIASMIDPSGDNLGVVDDTLGLDVYGTIEADTSGTYTLEVADYSDGTGDYTVLVDPAGSPFWEDLGLA